MIILIRSLYIINNNNCRYQKKKANMDVANIDVADMDIEDILFECDHVKIAKYETYYLKVLGKTEPTNDEKVGCYEKAVRKVYMMTMKAKSGNSSHGEERSKIDKNKREDKSGNEKDTSSRSDSYTLKRKREINSMIVTENSHIFVP